MKLLTQQILKDFEKQGDTSEMQPSEVKIIAKFFNPQGAGNWYATEYHPDTQQFFGFVSIFNDYNDELGYFTLAELESFRGRMGLPIERDRYFGDYTLDQVIDGLRP